MKVFLFLTLILSMSCKSHEKAAVESSIEGNQEEYTRIMTDNYGGTETAQIQVIREKGALIKFFAQINKTRKPGLPVPEIDFTKEMILVYCFGKTTLEKVPGLFLKEENDQEKILGIMDGENQMALSDTAVKMPFSLYKVPLSEKEFVLQRNE